MKLLPLLIFATTLTLNFAAIIVQTSLGKVQGKITRLNNGVEFQSFLGIPYAEPPVGPLRFQKPKAKEPWTGIFKATHHPQCTQIPINQMLGMKRVFGTEDCLALSVYTPSQDTVENPVKLPVMVWIHGGGFVMDSGNCQLYGPDYLMEYNVVLVTINYRLGPFGFLSTGDEFLPGNQGLWDTIEALKWVKQNIEFFNGDPDKVTIAGESAGSMIVMSMYLSGQAKGLFHAAIAQSGVLNIPMLYQNGTQIQHFKELAEHVGCSKSMDNSAILECLQEADESAIASILKDKFLHSDAENYLANPYLPIDDCSYNGQTIFSQDPLDMMDNGEFNDVPLILGSNKDEGMTFLPVFVPPNAEEFVRKHIKDKIPQLLLGKATNLKHLYKLSMLYFGTTEPKLTESDFQILSQIFTDAWFQMPAIMTGLKLANHAKSPVFLYQYGYHGSMNFCDLVDLNIPKFVMKLMARYAGSDLFQKNATCHGDELLMLFKSCEIPMHGQYSDMDKKVAHGLLSAWTNFMTFGHPGQPWERLDSKLLMRLEFDPNGDTSMKLLENDPKVQYWMDFYNENPPKLDPNPTVCLA